MIAIALPILMMSFCLPTPVSQDNGAGVSQQEKRVRLEMIVTSSTSLAVFVEKGELDGLRLDSTVTFHPPGEAPAEGLVRQLSGHHARIELHEPERRLPVGTPGEAWLLREESAPEVPTTQTTDALNDSSEDPPTELPLNLDGLWRSPSVQWSADRPLLEDPDLTKDEERGISLRGRLRLSSAWRASGEDGSRQSLYSRSALSWTLENPFSKGGQVQFNGEGFARQSQGTLTDSSDQNLRLTRLSYEQPGDGQDSARWILGRYSSPAFPEFGWVDGAEWAQRLDSQNEVGFSLGHIPTVQGELDLSNRSQASFFYRHLASLEHPFDWRIGYQKSWKGKQQDRDLWVLDGSYHGSQKSSYSGTLWLDDYREDDDPKGNGPELTRLFLRTRQPLGKDGQWGLSYSEFRFPKTLGIPLTSFPIDEVFEDETRRIGFDVWGRFESGIRYRSRLDRWWSDGDTNSRGLSGNLGFTLERGPWEDTQLDLSIFASHGGDSDQGTLRLDLRSLRAPAYWTLGVELAGATTHPLESPRTTTWQPQVHGAMSFQPAGDWSLSLDGFAGWGDLGKTLNLSAHLVWSF